MHFLFYCQYYHVSDNYFVYLQSLSITNNLCKYVALILFNYLLRLPVILTTFGLWFGPPISTLNDSFQLQEQQDVIMGLRRDLAGASARLTDMTGRYLLLYLVFTIYILNNSCILIMAVYGIHCGPVLMSPQPLKHT